MGCRPGCVLGWPRTGGEGTQSSTAAAPSPLSVSAPTHLPVDLAPVRAVVAQRLLADGAGGADRVGVGLQLLREWEGEGSEGEVKGGGGEATFGGPGESSAGAWRRRRRAAASRGSRQELKAGGKPNSATHPHALRVDGVAAAQDGRRVDALKQELEADGAVLVHRALHALVVALRSSGGKRTAAGWRRGRRRCRHACGSRPHEGWSCCSRALPPSPTCSAML